MNNLFASRWAKMILAGLLAIMIAVVSSVGTYFYMRHERQDGTTAEMTTGETTEKEKPTEDASTETTAFSIIVESMKQQAHDAIFTQGYPEKGIAIEAVGEGLKEILTSEYAALLDNNTFHSDAFSVVVTEYPLRENRSIQRIRYTMKNNGDAGPYEESYYFLRYIGETSFFSDIEYGNSREKAFQVFENKDGCFAFLVSSGYARKTYSSNTEFSNYSAEIFIPEDAGFFVEQTEIPLGIASNYSLQLIQQDDTIKAIVPDAQNEPECVFNSSTLAFEMPKGAWESEPVSYDLPGLLLGLSDSQGNIRTLFVRKEGEKIRADEYAGQIIFQRQNKLFSLKHFVWYDEQIESYEDQRGKENDYLAGMIDIKKVLCVPLGADLDFEITRTVDDEMWSFCESTDIPLYVGEEYICYMQKSYFSGGGTFRASPAEIRFDKLDDLSKFSFSYRMNPDFQEKTLADLVYGKKADDFYQADVRTYGGQTSPYVDFKQLAIKRNLGKWSLMLPVMEEYAHPGNISSGNWINDFAAFSNDVPVFLASNSEAMEMSGSWAYWDAKDLMKFPGSDAFLAQYDHIIGVGNRKDGDNFEESTDLKMPVGFDEYIVSICFADDTTQEMWLSELGRVR